MTNFTSIIGDVARYFFSEPNAALSSRGELRFGSKGSLSVNLKKGTWYDWEADEGGGVVDLVAREAGLAGRAEAVEWLRDQRYIEKNEAPPPRAARPRPKPPVKQSSSFAMAMRIWKAAAPADGTKAAAYLASRGIQLEHLPRRLRFAPRLEHYKRNADGAYAVTAWPGMVALVTRGLDDAPIAVHRTFLAKDGLGKAPVDPSKMLLGRCHGGAVKLAAPAEHLLVGEGIETCLSASQATGIGAWAALSTSGLMNLELPPEVRRVTVLADNDPPNPRTGARPGEAAARAGAARWRRQGREVRIAVPPDEGTDFNDMLMKEGSFHLG